MEIIGVLIIVLVVVIALVVELKLKNKENKPKVNNKNTKGIHGEGTGKTQKSNAINEAEQKNGGN